MSATRDALRGLLDSFAEWLALRQEWGELDPDDTGVGMKIADDLDARERHIEKCLILFVQELDR